jgi:hypothetical protein
MVCQGVLGQCALYRFVQELPQKCARVCVCKSGAALHGIPYEGELSELFMACTVWVRLPSKPRRNN